MLVPENMEFNIFLYLGYLKVAVTMFKYIPLVYWNYVRKSTEGFSAASFIFDLCGASFSLTQETIDYYDKTSDTLNPIKLGLGMFSGIYDVVLLFQHFVLYRKRAFGEKDVEKGTGKGFVELV
jgi:cystinosin